jgi:demethylmenaquinone methyltransferase/2-methoxy-6-polyprenyl-1,4-benzoquinol methylase
MSARVYAPYNPTMMPPSVANQANKQEYVRSLFDGIAPRYDFLNHFLSSGFDILWRKKAINQLRRSKPTSLLDIATGTADVAIEAAKALGVQVTGVDISTEMLKIACQKVARLGLDDKIRFERGQAESLRFDAGSFDAATVAFGVRNFADVRLGLSEMHRVLKPQGVAVVLEFSKPNLFPVKQLFGFYFRRILPLIGGLVSTQRESYEYLPNSVRDFPDGAEFLGILEDVGFSRTAQYPLTLGIATIYVGTK